MNTILSIFFFIFGTLWGSFFNVCIFRIPKGKSIVFPPSHCTKCLNSIRWYDNIPLVSFLFLRGKCRFCQAPISFQYPAIELFCGLVFLLLYLQLDISFELFFYLFISSFLIIGAMIDLRYFILPEFTTIVPLVLTIMITILADLFGFHMTLLRVQELLLEELLYFKIPLLPQFFISITGAFLGFLGFLFIGQLGKLLFRKDALGGGDIVLMAFIGSLTGPIGVFIVTLIGSLFGSLIGLVAMSLKLRKKPSQEEHIWQEEDFSFADEGYYLPFGPFLTLGAIVTILYGPYFIFYLFGMYSI